MGVDDRYIAGEHWSFSRTFAVKVTREMGQ